MEINERLVDLKCCSSQEQNFGISSEEKKERVSKIECCAFSAIFGGGALASIATGTVLYVADISSLLGAATIASGMTLTFATAAIIAYCKHNTKEDNTDPFKNIIG